MEEEHLTGNALTKQPKLTNTLVSVPIKFQFQLKISRILRTLKIIRLNELITLHLQLMPICFSLYNHYDCLLDLPHYINCLNGILRFSPKKTVINLSSTQYNNSVLNNHYRLRGCLVLSNNSVVIPQALNQRLALQFVIFIKLFRNYNFIGSFYRNVLHV